MPSGPHHTAAAGFPHVEEPGAAAAGSAGSARDMLAIAHRNSSLATRMTRSYGRRCPWMLRTACVSSSSPATVALRVVERRQTDDVD
jgi:hypothetical protein